MTSTDQNQYFPDVQHITEFNTDVGFREKDCSKSKYHDLYITMDRFSNLCQDFSSTGTSQSSSFKQEEILMKEFQANNKLPEFLEYMTFLTGLIMVKHDKCKLTIKERFFSIWLKLITQILCKMYVSLKHGNLVIGLINCGTSCKLTFMAMLTGFSKGKQTGSGFIQKIRRIPNRPCPCHVCIKSGEPETRYAIVTLTTVLHVFDKECGQALKRGFIKDKWRSENTQVRLFYNKKEDKTEKLYGYRLLETDKEVNIESDWCAVECVTHDMDLVGKLERNLDNYMKLQEEIYNNFIKNKATSTYKSQGLGNLVIIIGHPHGGPKKMSIGKFDPSEREVLKEVRNYQRWCSYKYDNITCCGSSGSPVFILGQALCGFGYWFGHPHNHSKSLYKDENGGQSSLGVECL